jgi:hypothetical protein
MDVSDKSTFSSPSGSSERKFATMYKAEVRNLKFIANLISPQSPKRWQYNYREDCTSIRIVTLQTHVQLYRSIVTMHLLYAFFWVILQSLNFIFRRFETICLLHLYRRVSIKKVSSHLPVYEDGTVRVFRNVGI